MSRVFMALAEGVNRICGAVTMRGGTEDDIRSITLTLDPETYDRMAHDIVRMRLHLAAPAQVDPEGESTIRLYGVLIVRGSAPKIAPKESMSSAADNAEVPVTPSDYRRTGR